jgi:pyruvate/2-oxoglutarate dehydrogenase complex dihydrolipoamide acyltransferase (E2) component
MTKLAKKELLPKKLLSKDKGSKKEDSIFASKKAQEIAEEHNVTPTGTGSGKNGKFTLADVNKFLTIPTKTKTNISPKALEHANANGLSIVGRTGSGVNGNITLKDVKEWLATDKEEETLKISPRAEQEAKAQGISDKEIAKIKGSGTDGRILLEDIRKHSSSSEGEMSDKANGKKKAKPIAKRKEESSDSESDYESSSED